MRKCIAVGVFCFFLLLFLSLTLFNAAFQGALREKSYLLEQRLIPILLMHPEDRISAYIANADALFALSQTQPDPETSVALAFRAEHSMTLLVGEVRRLNSTADISSSLLFGTYENQEELLSSMIERSTGEIREKLSTILSFSKENEKTTKTIYYNAIHPGTVVPL